MAWKMRAVKQVWIRWVMAALLGVAVLGLGRVSFNTDVLSVLPQQLPEVKGLQGYQEVFSQDEELVVMLRTTDAEAGMARERVRELATKLEEAGVTPEARWQPRWRADASGLADLVAWLWLNGDPEELAELEASLSEGEIDATLQSALQRIATSLEGGEMVLSGRDPFGFLQHSSLGSLLSTSDPGGTFESGDGRSHLLFVKAPTGLSGYEDYAGWIDEVRAVADPWEESQGVKLWWTGDPAFEAEIGTAMERDMSGTVGITSLLIAGLFLLIQRRVSLLAGLGVVLALVFVVALGLAGWIYGDLSIMAAGFAAILIGLAVDYGVLICQEAKVAGHDGEAIRRATGRSIAWAAATTAAVFFALNFSGLPGIAQLGTMVGCGVVVGAVLMLWLYLPWVARCGAGRPGVAGRVNPLVGSRGAVIVAGILALGSAGLLTWRGMPAVEFSRDLLQPSDSEAMAAFETIQDDFPEWNSPTLKLVLEAETEEEMLGRIDSAVQRLESLRADHPEFVKRYELPGGWWPHSGQFLQNRSVADSLSQEQERILEAASEAGFSDEGMGLGRAVLEAFPRVRDLPPGEVPQAPAAQEILRRVLKTDGSGGKLLGSVEVSEVQDLSREDFTSLQDVSADGIYLAGWVMLKPAVLPLVKQDLLWVFLPMLGLMLMMLTLIFRSFADVLLALGGLTLSGLLLLTGMKLLGLSWNFLNIAATPLLLGVGLDYTIHLLLALRRSNGDLRAVWNGTGKAVLFCGCSTAIGFGSLCFASIDALASLGKITVLGILIMMSVGVLLLPGVRRAIRW